MLLATVQHTGTWFLIYILEQITGKKVSLFKEVLYNRKKFELLHTHITTTDAGVHDKDILKHIRPWLMDALVNLYPTVIPIRDPLASLITRENRHPELNHEYIVHSFQYVAQLDKSNVFLFPIDLKESYAERLELLNGLAEFMKVPANTQTIKTIALNWNVKNSAGDASGLKKQYRKGYYKSIRRKLNSSCKLLESKPEIAAFLHHLGYGKFIWE